ncbi:MAG: fumarylacetoacetate hydrolase family protein, partial [Bryobacteraceae bacterium]
MRFVTFVSQGAPEPGVVRDGGVVSLKNAGFSDMLAVIAGDRSGLERYVASAPLRPLSTVVLLAPIPRPPKIICVGLNYRDHAIESKMEIPKVPTIFSKYSTAVIGPGEEIVLPRNSVKPDYEAEFAVIVGR